MIYSKILFSFCTEKFAVINCAKGEAESKIEEILSAQVKKFVIKSKTVTAEHCELNYEVRLKDNSTDFIDSLVETEGVESAVLVSHNGDYMN